MERSVVASRFTTVVTSSIQGLGSTFNFEFRRFEQKSLVGFVTAKHDILPTKAFAQSLNLTEILELCPPPATPIVTRERVSAAGQALRLVTYLERGDNCR